MKKYRVPDFESGALDEPRLLFGGGNDHVDPKFGLSIFGPFSSTPTSIIVGIIGIPSMIADTEQWLERCTREVTNDKAKPREFPPFTGISSDSSFNCELKYGDLWCESLNESEIEKILRINNFNQKVSRIVELYEKKLETLAGREPQPDVIICCIPQNVIDYAVVEIKKWGELKRRRISKTERMAIKLAEFGQQFFFKEDDPRLGIEGEQYGHHNLRRGLKARAMQYGIPTQLIWPRTIKLGGTQKRGFRERVLQDDATRAWNFVVALYHKAKGIPWRLANIKPGVCFVGISFFKERAAEYPRMCTSMAQTFSFAGEGYVLRGKSFEWTKDVSPHLRYQPAKELMNEVIELYKTQNKGLPRRVVVHKSSRFWEDEINGFHVACKDISEKDFVTIGKRGIQFYRPGIYPPLRGTYVKFSDKNFLLYTDGYVPFLRTYPGPRVPQPLEILEHHGDSPWNTVLEEILALTKINWNTADFSCSKPITLAFAQRVGDILAELPPGMKERNEYRFYM
ncbi:hypothetical protein CEE36_03440 [candidate division TA06 bacterium B3_TA06]|uniref:Piwi domain-containing protein n=1 Tax=candidate division TA06 bacterium B3_TA06 TaxID=2012487 RepID=A0A532V968_UNCT6|nr:MAG: hypothetical protein CEE36_03440 [candidate division TA06 bacterium B3_TA06]